MEKGFATHFYHFVLEFYDYIWVTLSFTRLISASSVFVNICVITTILVLSYEYEYNEN